MQTILIIDDHPLFRAAIRDIIGRLFAAKGWNAHYREASSFREAFDHASAAPDLDLVTLDIYLPDSNDLSSLLRFRRSLGRVSVPVCPVALSGRIPVVALVSHYLTNKLIGREVILHRNSFKIQ
jgi:DNA-binding NarL/FixJ family response regulator